MVGWCPSGSSLWLPIGVLGEVMGGVQGGGASTWKTLRLRSLEKEEQEEEEEKDGLLSRLWIKFLQVRKKPEVEQKV